MSNVSLTIVGLGPGIAGYLSLETMHALENAERTRLDAELELHVERITEQCGADCESEQELTAERPTEQGHAGS